MGTASRGDAGGRLALHGCPAGVEEGEAPSLGVDTRQVRRSGFGGSGGRGPICGGRCALAGLPPWAVLKTLCPWPLERWPGRFPEI